MWKTWKSFILFFSIVWLIFGLFTLMVAGNKYIGKSYFKSNEFQLMVNYMVEELGPYALNIPTAEQLKSQITVKQHEIEAHRSYYGSLSEQVESIKTQYEEAINEAVNVNATDLKTKLEQERDDKIKDITENFTNDEHVREKIIAQKEKQIDDYMKGVKQKEINFKKQYRYWSYELTNMNTGETKRFGDINADNAYKMQYTEQAPLSTAITSDEINQPSDTGEIISYSDDYTGVDYTGTIAISKEAVQQFDDYQTFKNHQYIFSFIWIMTIVVGIYLWSRRMDLAIIIQDIRDHEWMPHIKFDVRLMVMVITAFSYWLTLWVVYEAIEYSYYPNFINVIGIIFEPAMMFVIAAAFYVQLIWLYGHINTTDKLVKNIESSYLWSLGDSLGDLLLNRSIALHSFIMLSAAFFGGGSLVVAMMGHEIGVFVLLICMFIGLPTAIVFLSRMGYLNRIMKDTEAMAAGRLHQDIKVKGKSPLAKHAKNLNHLREGVRTSMHEQAKSERLKTELITNVSHDLRTPLTSIITYTDLLKKPNITEEERQQYIQILDKKSERLKVLIEDLFEVSKMASGNIELHRSRVDVNQLVQQAVGEHKEDFIQAQLDLRMTMPHDAVYAYVDGQKWWRLIDNLVVNVLKYAMEGTRVYVTLKRTIDGEIEFAVKNVAKYEINENAEELFERFKRADASRHTEGSGLGLAIAQSIVDLHGARMTIDVDGDLFKVIVRIPVV
ncbi:sensor histidine kinase [Lysinibacillus piscis]|uniref:histidine kinase n=1 Tax=Lysinibacillus piscis TaxID=2518931 RepID=A0ABQ5NJ21_9BACI|nr:HAMP domain-containing sensor histidine kinase [Lysinibacillus sp. KH24]GLC88072.1 two-component sensor histidine kinase [Lysinibacillus sp. KH24]